MRCNASARCLAAADVCPFLSRMRPLKVLELEHIWLLTGFTRPVDPRELASHRPVLSLVTLSALPKSANKGWVLVNLVLPSTRRGTGPILENSCCDPSNPLSRRHPHHCHDQLKGTLSSRATVLIYCRGCRLPHKGGMWSGDGPYRASGAPAASRVWIAPVDLDEQDA